MHNISASPRGKSPAAPASALGGQAARPPAYIKRILSLRSLAETIETLFNINAVKHITYALAADINCLYKGAPRCLLASRGAANRLYSSPNAKFTFYPLTFHPNYSNFTFTKPPSFIKNSLQHIRLNISMENNNVDVAIATAALTLPSAGAGINKKVKKTQKRLLSQEYAFRIEQVITVSVSKLLPEQQSVANIIRPLMQLICLFLSAKNKYKDFLRAFKADDFPSVLRPYAKLFETATMHMLNYFIKFKRDGLPITLSEGMSAVDRLGNFCFTGDPRVLPNSVFKFLGTMASIRKHAWPYIDPENLSMRGKGRINMSDWPGVNKKRVYLIHSASLQFYYGRAVASSRETEAKLALGSSSTSPSSIQQHVVDIFNSQFVPEMRQFFAHRMRVLLKPYQDGLGKGAAAALRMLDDWDDEHSDDCTQPTFSNE
ncbi:hypothetical protein V8C42DRAFT_349586 [Trichoderma barbatum]